MITVIFFLHFFLAWCVCVCVCVSIPPRQNLENRRREKKKKKKSVLFRNINKQLKSKQANNPSKQTIQARNNQIDRHLPSSPASSCRQAKHQTKDTPTQPQVLHCKYYCCKYKGGGFKLSPALRLLISASSMTMHVSKCTVCTNCVCVCIQMQHNPQ